MEKRAETTDNLEPLFMLSSSSSYTKVVLLSNDFGALISDNIHTLTISELFLNNVIIYIKSNN